MADQARRKAGEDLFNLTDYKRGYIPGDVIADKTKLSTQQNASNRYARIIEKIRQEKPQKKDKISSLLEKTDIQLSQIEKAQMKRIGKIAEEFGDLNIMLYNPAVDPDLFEDSLKKLGKIIEQTAKDSNLYELIKDSGLSFNDIAFIVLKEMFIKLPEEDRVENGPYRINVNTLLDEIEAITDAISNLSRNKRRQNRDFFF